MQLNYRGTTFTLQPATTSLKSAVTVTRYLMYRGVVKIVQMPIQTTKPSKVTNWRFTAPCQFTSQELLVAQA